MGQNFADEISQLLSTLRRGKAAARDRARERLISIGAPAAESVRILALSRSWSARMEGAAILGAWKFEEDFIRLSRLSEDAQWVVRRAAVTALSGYPQGAEAIAPLVADPEPLVREAVALALGRFPDQAAVLCRLFADSRPSVVRAALASVQSLRVPGAYEALSRLLDAELGPAQRHRVIAALGATGDLRALPLLTELLEHPDSRMRVGAAEGLGAMARPQAEAPLRERLGFAMLTGERDLRVRRAIHAALKRLKSEAADLDSLPMAGSGGGANARELPLPGEAAPDSDCEGDFG